MTKVGARKKYPNSERNRRKRDTEYRIIGRHLDFFLGEVLSPEHDALYSLEEIRKLLDEETGVLFHTSTLKRYLKKYREKYGESPLCPAGDDKWRLNHCYFRYAKIKPPKPRNYEIDI